MINVTVYGADEFLGKHIETMMLPSISKIYNVKNDDVIFTCVNSMIYHGGVDQTSFHIVFKIELNETYKNKEKECAKYVLDISKNFAVHAHLGFVYLNSEEYSRIDDSYPLYVSESNSVEASVNNDEESGEEEIYTGNIFEEFDEFKTKK